MAAFSQITALFTLLLIIFSPSSSSAAKIFKKIYAFGDSFTDTGNTHSTSGPSSFTYVSNPPYGRTFFHRPTNRYSDGRLVIDFVAQALSLPFLPPYLNRKADTSYGVNFAVAGSTAIDHRFFVENNITLDITPQSLDTQLSWFNRYLEGVGCRDYKSTPMQCGAVFDDALFWVGEIGANDYAYTFGSSISPKTIQHLAVTSVSSFIQALLKKGAKYVVVEGLPTTGCLTLALYLAPPADRDAMGCVATVNNQSHTHNAILQSNLAAFRRGFPEATIVYADYWNAYKSILTAAKSHGITQPFRACCGSGAGDLNFEIFATCGSPDASSCADPSQYINWDGVHLTEAMYKAVADKFVNGTFCHPPFSYLIRKKMASALLA
nr:GDSL esterase/lipase At3g48460 [Ipomoea batatas]